MASWFPFATLSDDIQGSCKCHGHQNCQRLVIAQATSSWAKFEDGNLVYQLRMDVLGAIKASAAERSIYNRYRYLHYATATQNAISGYGEESVAMLRRVSEQWDSYGLVQEGCVGGFKLWWRSHGRQGRRECHSTMSSELMHSNLEKISYQLQTIYLDSKVPAMAVLWTLSMCSDLPK